MLLLSGVIQLNPGPLRNSTPVQDAQLDTPETTLVRHDHTRGTEPVDMFQMESLFAELQQPISDSILQPDECGLQNRTDGSGLPTELQLSCSCHRMRTGRKCAVIRATSKSCAHCDRSVPGDAEGKHWQFRFFQTVNHAKAIWDSKTKPKGIVGGHLNIRSVISKRDQVQHLLTDSFGLPVSN